jgi:hypothetical protein
MMNEEFMKKSLTYTVILCAALTALLFHNPIEACGESKGLYHIERDSFGRTILIWTDPNVLVPAVKVSINNGPPTIISPEGQSCQEPTFEVTKDGDIVALWSTVNNGTLDLYSSILPYKDKWTTPVCISNGVEGVLANTYKLIVSDSNDLNVYWESVTYYLAYQNPNFLCSKRELRCAKGTSKNWSPAETLVMLYCADDSHQY